MAEEKKADDILDRILQHYEGQVHYLFPENMITAEGEFSPIEAFRIYIRGMIQERGGMIAPHELEDACQTFIQDVSAMEGSQERPPEQRATMDDWRNTFDTVIRKLTDEYGDVRPPQQIVQDVSKEVHRITQLLGRDVEPEEILSLGEMLDAFYSQNIRQRMTQEDESLFGDPPAETSDE
jgi:hypothetical protein